MSEHLSSTSPDRFTVVAWNILLDRKHGDLVPPQDKRLDLQVSSLRDVPAALDVVAILEAEKTKTQHNGEVLAANLGFTESHWLPHSRKREYIGMFGKRVDEVEYLDMGHNKAAVITMIGSVCVVAAHLKFPRSPCEHLSLSEQRQQIEVVLDRVKDEEHAVIMGDFNCPPWRKPRQLIEAQGFQSVYRIHGEPRPHTVLRGEYDFMLTPHQRRLIRRVWPLGVNVDDIYVKNMMVHEVGTVIGESDHLGVWATLSPDTTPKLD